MFRRLTGVAVVLALQAVTSMRLHGLVGSPELNGEEVVYAPSVDCKVHIKEKEGIYSFRIPVRKASDGKDAEPFGVKLENINFDGCLWSERASGVVIKIAMACSISLRKRVMDTEMRIDVAGCDDWELSPHHLAIRHLALSVSSVWATQGIPLSQALKDQIDECRRCAFEKHRYLSLLMHEVEGYRSIFVMDHADQWTAVQSSCGKEAINLVKEILISMSLDELFRNGHFVRALGKTVHNKNEWIGDGFKDFVHNILEILSKTEAGKGKALSLMAFFHGIGGYAANADNCLRVLAFMLQQASKEEVMVDLPISQSIPYEDQRLTEIQITIRYLMKAIAGSCHQEVEGRVIDSLIQSFRGVAPEKYQALSLLMHGVGPYRSIFALTKDEKLARIRSWRGSGPEGIMLFIDDIVSGMSVEDLQSFSNGDFLRAMAQEVHDEVGGGESAKEHLLMMVQRIGDHLQEPETDAGRGRSLEVLFHGIGRFTASESALGEVLTDHLLRTSTEDLKTENVGGIFVREFSPIQKTIRNLVLNLAIVQTTRGSQKGITSHRAVHLNVRDLVDDSRYGALDRYRAFSLLMHGVGDFSSVYAFNEEEQIRFCREMNHIDCKQSVIELLSGISVEELKSASNIKFVTAIGHFAYCKAKYTENDGDAAGVQCLIDIMEKVPDTEPGKQDRVAVLFDAIGRFREMTTDDSDDDCYF